MSEFFENLYIAAASGLEAVVKRELINAGFEPGGAIYGKIPVNGNLRDAAYLNLSLRTANRVYLCLAKGEANSFDDVYEQVKKLPFKDFLPRDARITVNASSHKSKLYALSALQRVTKRAICDAMGGSLSETGATYSFTLDISDDVMHLLLDTSGEALHKRGYRKLVGAAPLSETTAAAMLLLTGYKGGVLADPFAGSGTIPIEAALMATNTAPGLKRSFAFENFPFFGADTTRLLREELSHEISSVRPDIAGYDIDPSAVSMANAHLKAAGLSGKVHFQVRPVSELNSRFRSGHVVTNPPYGKRLGTGDELKKLYLELKEAKGRLPGFTFGIISAYPAVERLLGKADRRRKLYNAELETTFYSYFPKLKIR